MESKCFNVIVDKVRIIRDSERGLRYESQDVRDRRLDVSSIREKLGINQAEFAEILGVHKRTIRNWEKGKAKPSKPALLLLRVADRWPEAFIDSLLEY